MDKFRFMGRATILHLNTRKEGPEDNQELALDLKLKTITDQLIMLYFDDLLPAFVYLSNGAKRSAVMGPITYCHELEDYRLDMVDSSFWGVKVKKFSIEPMDGFKAAVTFSVSLKPSGDEVARIAEFLQDEIELCLTPSGNELDFGGTSANSSTSTVDPTDEDDLFPMARDLVISQGRASISMVQRHLRIGYNRAAHLLESLEYAGVVSAMDSSGARKVLVQQGETA